MRFVAAVQSVLSLCVVWLSVAADAAHACGGLFCSTSPVDQSGEQIIVEQLPDGSITTTVELSFTGNDSEFSWIIPVPGTPSFVNVASPLLFPYLDTLTRPRIIGPYGSCWQSDGGEEGEGEGEVPTIDAVVVDRYPNAGPYGEIVVVNGVDPQVLMDWLSTHGYLVTEAMRPVITEYAIEGSRFLALRLRPEADVSQIVPVRFHCPAPDPTIPMRITRVSAQPQMQFAITVFAQQRMEPWTWGQFEVNPDEIVWNNDTFTSNYPEVVAYHADQQGGRAFAVEMAGPSSQLSAGLNSIYNNSNQSDDDDSVHADLTATIERSPFVTRFYTRISPEEMTIDPVFVPSVEQGEVSNIFDLSSRPDPACGPVQPPPACSFVYCGANAVCATDANNNAGCVCGENEVGRMISSASGPGGTSSVSCVSNATNTFPDNINAQACSATFCGEHGRCAGLNGSPTCACDAGYMVVLDASAFGPMCAPYSTLTSPDIVLAGHGPELSAFYPKDGAPSCASCTTPLWWAMPALLVWVTQRRRRWPSARQ